jgi:hypothetical protein
MANILRVFQIAKDSNCVEKDDSFRESTEFSKQQYVQRVLQMRKVQRERIQRKHDLKALLISDVETNNETQHKVAFTISLHPDECPSSPHPLTYVRSNSSTTVVDVVGLIRKEICVGIKSLGAANGDILLYLLSPSLGPAGAPSGCHRRFAYPINNDSLTLGEIRTWCDTNDLPLHFVFKRSVS